jgi:hypothetical protein
MNKHLYRAAFCVGLLAIGWVGYGYLHTNPLALAMTMLIVAFYAMGALELQRFHRATAGLATALDTLPAPRDGPAPDLSAWLACVPESLQSVVRLRIEGERVALPGPSMAPYLAGLLVLLGMLGTFLGMVVTLNGTGLALERATDLQTMRDSLAAPVKGLGLAFGTSVAGVAASAMLGLMSALCRRERLQAAQGLDRHAAGALRSFTLAHQRQQALELQQQQARLMPALVEQLQSLVTQLDQQTRLSNEQLLAGQQRFHGQAEAAYRELAASVGRSLQGSLAESARIASASWQPVVETTMNGIARETTALHAHIGDSLQRLLDGLASHAQASTQSLSDSHAALGDRLSGALTAQLDAVSVRLDAAVAQVSTGWQQALARQERTNDGLAEQTRQSLAEASGRFESQAAALLAALDRSQTGLQASLASGDERRLAAWTDALAAMAATLQQDWRQAGELAQARQERICDTLEQTAGRIAAQAEAHASGTITEIARLVQSASEAPRAAAEVVAQLRDKLSDSMARDNAMLDERSRIMATLNSLLDAVQHTSTEQRTAIDQLVGSTAAWLEQAGARFTEKMDAESARLEGMAAQLTGSAVDVASLGEAFGLAVELFSQSSDRLMGHLQRVDDTLGRSIARSDEQLAYYVAQAREVIDLSLMAQKQILDDLQRLAGSRMAAASEA